MPNRFPEIPKYRIFESSKNPLSDLSDLSDKKLVDLLTRRLFDLLKFVAFCSY